MEPVEGWTNNCNCDSSQQMMQTEVLKPLERRKLRHQRCLAHSLVGTPNYIAPEVLLRSGERNNCFTFLASPNSKLQHNSGGETVQGAVRFPCQGIQCFTNNFRTQTLDPQDTAETRQSIQN